MEMQKQQAEEYEKQRQQQIEQAKKFKEEQERKRQEAQKKATKEDDESGEEESEDTEDGSEDTDEESDGEEEDGKRVSTKKEVPTKEREKQMNEQAKKGVQKATTESTKTPNLQPIKRQDDSLLGASPRTPGNKTSSAVSLPSIGSLPSPTKGNSVLGAGGLSPSVGDSMKGATVGRAGLLPLGKGRKNKGTWRRNKVFTSRSHGN